MSADHTFAICAYKTSPYLQNCIDSLKNQTYQSQIIICTSTSNDFLKQIAQKNHLKLIVNPGLGGIANDWNFALSQAKTQYLTLAHQDDVYFPAYATEIMRQLKADSKSLIAYADYSEIVHKSDKVFERNFSLNFLIKKLINFATYLNQPAISQKKQKLLLLGSPIGCPAVTYNLKNLTGFKFSTEFSINMDWFAWLTIAQKPGSFFWIRHTLMSHRIHLASETSKGLADNRRQSEDERMFKLLWPSWLAKTLTQLYALSYLSNY